MSRRRNGIIMRDVVTLFKVGITSALTDGQLLEQFSTRRGEGSELAFAELVGRHGTMVLRACRAIVGHEHDAQDAFQATFLILARSGGSLWVRDSLGPWLHRVACRVAVHARRADRRRKGAERTAAEDARGRGICTGPDDRWQDLHEAIDRLPERYRAPIVLCDLEGRSYEDAARCIGCPIGTVKSRLARGRDRLRDRLVRRGPATLGTVPMTVLPAQAMRGEVPRLLVEETTKHAIGFAVDVPVSGPVAALAKVTLGRMAMTTLGKVACATIGLGLVGGALVGRSAAPPAIAAEAAVESRDEVARSDLETIRGTWMPVSTSGRTNAEFVRRVRMVVKEDTERPEGDIPAGSGRFVFEWKTEGEEHGSTNRVLLDPTRTPKTLDFFPEAPAAPKVCPGIYKLEGDVLTICFRSQAGERPKGFTDPQRGETLDVYRRAKP